MSDATLRTAGILLIILPTVAFGGASILYLWLTKRSEYYLKNPLRQRLWAAGHAHAGVLLILSLVSFLYLDATNLSAGTQAFVRSAIPLAAILVPAAYFLSVVNPNAEKPNALINLAYVGFLSLTAGLLVLGFGILSAL
jgi:hypothetical protein